VAHAHDLFVGDEGVDARARGAAKAHAAVVVHEGFVGLKHHHGVAAGVAVGDEVHGRLVVMLVHVFGVEEVFADFQQGAGGVAVRAAGAIGGGADGDAFGKFKAAGFFDGVE